jgi:hypothetical protein
VTVMACVQYVNVVTRTACTGDGMKYVYFGVVAS